MKKRIFIIAVAIAIAMSTLSSCATLFDPAFQEGFRQGWNTTAPEEYRY